MNIAKYRIFAPMLLAFGCIAFSAGCSTPTITGGDLPQMQSPLVRSLQARHGWLSPAAKTSKTLVYVADFLNNFIAIYRGTAPYNFVGQIYDGVNAPDRVSVDDKQNLFVVNSGNHSVTEYKRGAISPSTTYTAGLKAPTAIAVDSHEHVYVVDESGIVEYQEGKPKRIGLRSVPGPAYGLAVNSKDDLYVTSFGASGPSTVYKLPSNSIHAVDLNFSSFLGNPEDVKLDAKGNLVIADIEKHVIYVVPPNAKLPSRQISSGLLYYPWSIALDATGESLYVSDVQEGLFIFDYATGAPIQRISQCENPGAGTWCDGVALDPAFAP